MSYTGSVTDGIYACHPDCLGPGIFHETICRERSVLGQQLKSSSILAGLNLLSYLVLTVDYRATAQANILWSILSNATIAVLTITILKRIVKTDSIWDTVAYAVGGILGNVLGIYLTVWILGK